MPLVTSPAFDAFGGQLQDNRGRCTVTIISTHAKTRNIWRDEMIDFDPSEYIMTTQVESAISIKTGVLPVFLLERMDQWPGDHYSWQAFTNQCWGYTPQRLLGRSPIDEGLIDQRRTVTSRWRGSDRRPGAAGRDEVTRRRH